MGNVSLEELKGLAESVGRVDGVSFINSVGNRQVDWFIRFSEGELVEFVQLVLAAPEEASVVPEEITEVAEVVTKKRGG